MAKKEFKCCVCKVPVPYEELRAKKGGIIQKKVFCKTHFTEALEKLKRKKDPQARSKPVPKVKQDSVPPENITGLQKMLITTLGSVVIFLLICIMAVIVTADPSAADTHKTKSRSGRHKTLESYEAVKKAAPPKPEPSAAETPALKPPIGGYEEEKGTEPLSEDQLGIKYREILTAAGSCFDGSMGGYKQGVRYIRMKVIDNPVFENTEYTDRAEKFLSRAAEKLNKEIGKEFSRIKTKVIKHRNKMDLNTAYRILNGFPMHYRSIQPWSFEYNSLKKTLVEPSIKWVEPRLEEAEAIFKTGNIKKATEYIDNLKTEHKNMIVDESSRLINIKASRYRQALEEKEEKEAEE